MSKIDIFMPHTKSNLFVFNCSCLFSLTFDFLKSKSSMAHVYCWYQENKASPSHTPTLPLLCKTITHTHTQTNTKTSLPQQQGKQTFFTQSAVLTLTLDTDRCVTQSHRIQSIEHNSSLVSDIEKQ